jgi:hypothetical protein
VVHVCREENNGEEIIRIISGRAAEKHELFGNQDSDRTGHCFLRCGSERMAGSSSWTASSGSPPSNLNSEFKLRLPKSEKEAATDNLLHGKRFKELPLNLQERIEDTQLTLYILDAKAPERAKLDIFDRVNSGVMLSRQQMRNSL